MNAKQDDIFRNRFGTASQGCDLLRVHASACLYCSPAASGRRPIRVATEIGQLTFCDLHKLLDIVRTNPPAAERRLLRMGVSADAVRAEIEMRKATKMQAIKALEDRKKHEIEEEQEQMRREALLATPLGRQTILVEVLTQNLSNAKRWDDAEHCLNISQELHEAQLRLDEMTGRRLPRKPSNLEGSPHTVFHGSDASATRAYYRRLSGLGFDGRLAAQLMRVQKSSSRAKLYRGKHGDRAYRNKEEAMAVLTSLLATPGCGIQWGWGVDDSPRRTHPCRHVLYVDLPTGQVSFHAMARGAGPDYGGKWDGALGASEGRIIRFAAAVEKRDLANPPGASAVECGRDDETKEQQEGATE